MMSFNINCLDITDDEYVFHPNQILKHTRLEHTLKLPSHTMKIYLQHMKYINYEL